MARFLYGATSADYATAPGGLLVPGAAFTAWSARTGGTQITDLTTEAGAATSTVTASSTGLIAFYGPDGAKTPIWLQPVAGGERTAVVPLDNVGEPPSIEIGTVTTGTAGATITGTSPDYTLDFVLPGVGVDGVDTAAIQDGAVTSDKIADGTIVDADINASAAIAPTKISGTALVASTVDAKGDILAATADNTVARVAVGANNTILTADSTAAAGVKWAAPVTRVGTGSPLSVVTPDFVGQQYIDTAATLGATRWRASTSAASGWVCVEGKTTFYNVSSLLINGWTGAVYLGRTESTLSIRGAIDPASATADMFMAPISGFLPGGPSYVDPNYAYGVGIQGTKTGQFYANAGTLNGFSLKRSTFNATGVISFDVTTTPNGTFAWPTAAPV